MNYPAKMARIEPLGIVGLLAVALVAHLWMFTSFTDTPIDSLDTSAASAPATATPVEADCPSGMSSCVSVETEKVLPLLLVTLSTLTWLRRRAPIAVKIRPRFRSLAGPPPRLTPVTQRVLLLE